MVPKSNTQKYLQQNKDDKLKKVEEQIHVGKQNNQIDNVANNKGKVVCCFILCFVQSFLLKVLSTMKA